MRRPMHRRCEVCLLYAAHCVCGVIAPRAAVREVLIFRHASERFRPSNSARLVALALTNARLIDHRGYVVGEVHPGAKEAALGEVPALPEGAVLLFPEGPPTARPPVDPRVIVAVDGTWSQARRMRQRQPALRGVPVWNVAVPAIDRERFRRPPRPGTVSTLEAIAAALGHLGDSAAAAALCALYDRAVAATSKSVGHRGARAAEPQDQ